MAETIEKHMTRSPHSVGQEQSLERAAEFMRENKVRHLPVLHGGELVGVLSDRDIVLMESVEHVRIADVTVEDAMSTDPYAVEPGALLAEVLGHMSEQNLGSVVVVEGNKVVGIYTSMDAVRMLGERV